MKKIILKFFLIITFIIFLISLYAFLYEPKHFITKETKITSDKIPNSFHGLKIVQISDIHYGRSIKNNELKKIEKEIKRLKPDIIVFTGDLFENGIKTTKEDKEILTTFLKNLDAKIDKYAITGEDDKNVSEFKEILKNSNFILLDETFEEIYNEKFDFIFLAGLSTKNSGNKISKDKMEPIYEKINSYNDEVLEDGTVIEKVKPHLSILITHEPDEILDIDYTKFDIIFAGHSHLGQVKLPLIKGLYYPNGSKTLKGSHYTLDSTEVYISAGLGTTKLPVRFLNQPEINLYRLTNR